MDPVTLAIVGFAGMFLLILIRVPIGIAMAFTGVAGFAVLVAPGPAFSIISTEIVSAFGSGSLATIPLFLLMGGFATAAGLSGDIYRCATAWIGHTRGGVAIATIFGCAGFGAVSGSSLATVGTFGRIAIPEMEKRGYSARLSLGTVAAGGTLGSLVPPSIIMIIYATLADVFLIDLFAAALLPAILAVTLHSLAIRIYVAVFEPDMQTMPPASWRERWQATIGAWRVILLAAAVLGGLYGGVFTANEAAAVGMILAVGFCALDGRLTRGVIREQLRLAASNAAMIYTIIIGASVLGYFMTITGAPRELAGWINRAELGVPLTLILILLFFIVMGCIFDTISAMIITMPFVIPIITGMGFDLIWWGIVMVTVIELGLVTPPIGLNIFVLHSILPKHPISTIFKGVIPFLGADVVRLVLVTSFPFIALWLPNAL